MGQGGGLQRVATMCGERGAWKGEEVGRGRGLQRVAANAHLEYSDRRAALTRSSFLCCSWKWVTKDTICARRAPVSTQPQCGIGKRQTVRCARVANATGRLRKWCCMRIGRIGGRLLTFGLWYRQSGHTCSWTARTSGAVLLRECDEHSGDKEEWAAIAVSGGARRRQSLA
jgi:hypothetical protein